MAKMIKIKIEKKKDVMNYVLLNLDNVTRVERLGDRIKFSIIDSTDVISMFPTVEDADKYFRELYSNN